MSVNNFIPAIWSANILQALEKSHVFASLANRNYEGEIKTLGDTVKINSLGDINIGTYTKNTDITAPQTLTDDQRTLEIDSAKFFNFQIDDVDKAQANVTLMTEAMRKAGYALSDVVDSYFAGMHASSTLTLGTDETPKEINSANVVDIILEINEKFNTADVQKDGRFIVMPAWFETKLILASILKETDNMSTLANGLVGRKLNFDFYSSNNVKVVGGNSKLIVGVKGQTFSFAEQINSVEAYRPEKRFADAVKGLHLYGGKVLRPEMTLTLTAKAKAEA